MKRVLNGLLVLLLIFSFASCTVDNSVKADDNVTMETIDEFLAKDARFIDLRNFSDFFNAGYIQGFEAVPFFQYLEGRALVRNNGWEFSSQDIISKAILENIFGDKEGTVVLMCGSGTRAGYVKSALESIGYTAVINAGGISNYNGDNLVLGDGSFAGVSVLPATVDMSNIDSFLGRPGAKYVDLRNVADKYVAGYIDGFELVSFFEYLENNALVRNNGWEFSSEDVISKIKLENIFGDKNREVFLMCGSGTRAGYVKSALESIGYKNVHNVGGIASYAGKNMILGDENFVLEVK